MAKPIGYKGGSSTLANASGTHEELQGVEDPGTSTVTPQPVGGLSASNPTTLVTPKLPEINIPTTLGPTPAAQPVPQPIGGASPSGTIAPPAFTPPPIEKPDAAGNVTTPQPVGGLSASNPVVFSSPKPVSQDIVTPQPQGKGALSPSTPIAADKNTGEAIVNPGTPTSVTTPTKTEPSLDDRLAHLDQILTDFADGKVNDAVFRTTANRAILQMGLNNQAETDALQMRINQDPSLRDQGAGRALLSMMTANHNFNADQMFGSLAQDAQQKILDLQKYGITQGMQINAQRRQNAMSNIQIMEDAGDFQGAAEAKTKLLDMPGVIIDPMQSTTARARTAAEAATLGAAGNYAGQAAKLAQLTGTPIDPANLRNRDPVQWTNFSKMIANGDFDGAATLGKSLGLNVSADQLRVRDTYMQGVYDDQMKMAKGVASTDPAAAEAAIDLMMKNPATKDRFAPGLTAHDLVNELVTGQYQENQDIIAKSNTEINAKAQSGTPFLQALTDYKTQPAAAWQALENQGKSLATSDLTAFNAARQKAGLGEFHKDANGNIVDDKGTPVTDEDFGETAAAADYQRRHDNQTKDMTATAYDMLYNGPLKDKILSIPGGEATVKSALATLFAGGGYSIDPQTGLIKGDYTSGLPWENAKTKYLYHNWPAANFGTDGTVTGKYDIGGEAYGDTIGGVKVQKLPDDEALDSNYQKYQYNGGDLSTSQWYFATAGGTKPVDKTKIPAELQATTGPDLTTPGSGGSAGSGTTSTAVTTPAGSTTPVGGRAADAQEFANIVNKTTSNTDAGTASQLIDDSNTIVNAYISKPVGTIIPLGTGSNTQFRNASDRLHKLGLTDEDMAKFADYSHTDKLIGNEDSWSGSPAFAYYAVYTNLIMNGMKEADAKTALTKLVGQSNADAALGLEKMHGASADYNPSAISSTLASIDKGFSVSTSAGASLGASTGVNPYDMGMLSNPLGTNKPIATTPPPKTETLIRRYAAPVSEES